VQQRTAISRGRTPNSLLSLFILLLCLSSLGAALTSSQARAATCPNEALRTGLSASLPDCRAYELVSPPGTNGRLLTGQTTVQFSYDQFPIQLFSPFGDSFLYMTFGTPIREVEEPTGSYDLYAAERSPSGWQTVRRLTPSGQQAVLPNIGGISADHSYMFVYVSPLASTSGGSLGDEGATEYLGSSDGSFEPVGMGSLGVERLAQGRYISPKGEHVIFATGGDWCGSCSVLQLEPEAPPTGTPAIYEREADGPTRVVSLLPGDVTPAAGEAARYQGSSADGSVVAFSVSGALYVRVNGEVTKKVTGGPFAFAGLSQEGAYLFYVSGGNIYRFNVATGDVTQVNASGDAQVVNISADGSHVYFISPSLLDGVEGAAGQPNMYVWTPADGLAKYIATVVSSDLERTSGEASGYPALTNWTSWAVTPNWSKSAGPGGNSSRTTPDGSVLVFESRAQLTMQETDGHTAIYRYDASDGSLLCVSCNPSSAPSTGDARLQDLEVAKPWIALNNVSEDGGTVFFETPESLVTRDVNGVNDIYRWRESNEAETSPLALISSGESPEYPPLIPGPENAPRPNIMLGISSQGNDVTFIALERLVPEASGGGSPGIYDARVNGGFPAAVPPPICSEVEACRQPPEVAQIPAPVVTSNRASEGNAKLRRRHRCRRFHRKGSAAKHKACHRKRSKKGAGK
jgi:hypothetical protein